MPLPLVSVVITTKNEEKNIDNCLRSIMAQTYPSDSIEIIVVDNNSSDATKKIAGRYTTKVFNLGPERSEQRNFGMIEKSSGEYVLFLDADMILDPGVISECVTKIKSVSPNLVALYIPEIVMGETFWCSVRRFERTFYNETAIDGLRFFQRQIFASVGGFDTTMYACEDWDLDKRIKKFGATSIIQSPLYHNESAFNMARYLKKKSYYSKNIECYVQKWGKSDPDVRKQLGFYYRYFKVFVENGKWRKIIAHPIKFFGVIFLKSLTGFLFLKSKLLK